MGREFIGMVAAHPAVEPDETPLPQRFFITTGPLFEGPGLTQEMADRLFTRLYELAEKAGLTISAAGVQECDVDGKAREVRRDQARANH